MLIWLTTPVISTTSLDVTSTIQCLAYAVIYYVTLSTFLYNGQNMQADLDRNFDQEEQYEQEVNSETVESEKAKVANSSIKKPTSKTNQSSKNLIIEEKRQI